MENLPGARIGLVGAVLRQMRHAGSVTLLLWLSLCAVVALHAFVLNGARFQNRSMELIMKDMGHNLWFLSSSAHRLDAMTASSGLPAIPDDRVAGLAADRGIASTYWGNLLQARITLRGQEVLLTGYEVVGDHQVTEEKDHLLEPLPPGTAGLGHALARAWDLEPGDLAEFNRRTYRVQRVHSAAGTLDDMRLWLPLSDAQAWLEQPGKVNVILGFLCMQGRSLAAGIERLERRMAEAHGDLQVVPLMNLLNARALARMTTSRYLRTLLLAMVIAASLLVAAVGCMEVGERRHELSILLAMGAGSGTLFALFLGKLLILALSACAAGFLLGSGAAVAWLSPFLVTHTLPVAVVWSDFPGILGRTLLLVGVAALLPMLRLYRLDPTRILAEE